MTSHLAPEDLTWLAADGRHATARLVASVEGLAGYFTRARHIPEADHDDVVQTMLQTGLTSAVHSWNPDVATWATWAGSHMKWEAVRYFERKADAKEVPTDVHATHVFDHGTSSDAPPEAKLIADLTSTEILHAIDRLPPRRPQDRARRHRPHHRQTNSPHPHRR